MKKRKTYEISVIDKTYSKTISDETKFYTSDTALELVFKLKETEYTFESAEIVLLNIDDRSLTTRPVSKVNNDFVYELDDDIIPHYGEWHGQLRFEAGEFYGSSPVKFRIENDLSNDRPPQLSDVQSWVSLKRYADKLTDDLKQAVLEVEGMDGTFNANELERQDKFETAEQSRQDTFETNEDIRQTQELEREKSETARQTVFDDNEASRFDTFNANETTRQTNESTRQQAESQRQSTFETNEGERQGVFETAEQERQQAELIRVENENQRKTDHANRSVELAGKADKVVIKNIADNGDFSQGSTGWDLQVLSLTDMQGTFVSTTGGYYPRVLQPIRSDIGDKIYIISKFKLAGDIDGVEYVKLTANNWYSTINPVITSGIENDKYYELSAIDEVMDIDGKAGLSTKIDKSLDGLIITLTIDYISFINLTVTFGAGNEPTKEEMDELIKVTGYIDGEYALNNKEMLIWTLALIRRNKNAIITLGGTI